MACSNVNKTDPVKKKSTSDKRTAVDINYRFIVVGSRAVL